MHLDPVTSDQVSVVVRLSLASHKKNIISYYDYHELYFLLLLYLS